MSDLKAVLNSDNTIKAVLSTNNNIKAVVNNGVTINNVIDGGQYIHFDVTENGSNLQFSSELLSQYSSPNNINIMKNGVYLNPSLFQKISANTIQINVGLTIGDALDILATGSAQIGGGGQPGGTNQQVQYNSIGTFAGNPGFTFNPSAQMVTMANATVTGSLNLANVSATNITSNANLTATTLKVTGTGNIATANANVLNVATNANIGGNLSVTGNISGSNVIAATTLAATNLTANGYIASLGNANIAGNLIANNITSNGNISTGNLSVSGTFDVGSLSMNSLTTTHANLGQVSNVNIFGGTNGFVLQTDGAGNLSWTAQTGGGGGGNGTPGGSNTQVQFNDAGSFGGDGNLTYNKVSGTLTVPKINSVFPVTASSQPNITQVGTLVNLTVTGTTTSGNVNSNFFGSGAGLTNIPGANVTGNVANATYATTAGLATNATNSVLAASANTALTVTTNAQPNITSVGTLGNLSVTGTITTNTANATNLNTANLTVLNAITGNINGSALTAFAVTTNAQPNITSVGTLSNLTVSGNVNAGNVSGTHYGSGLNLSSISGANVQGVVANATFATSAGYANTTSTADSATVATTAVTVSASSQPNITSVGTLTTLSTLNILTDSIRYANGNPWVFSTYGNGDVANYLPTYNGNLNSVNLSAVKATINSGSAKGLIEPVSYNSGSISTTQNIDVLSNTVYIYNTAGTANVTVNVRGNSTTTLNNAMNTNESITFNITMRNPAAGSTCVITNLQVDGSSVTVRWFGTAPGSVNTGFDVYTITVIKIASNSFIAFGARGSTT